MPAGTYNPPDRRYDAVILDLPEPDTFPGEPLLHR